LTNIRVQETSRSNRRLRKAIESAKQRRLGGKGAGRPLEKQVSEVSNSSGGSANLELYGRWNQRNMTDQHLQQHIRNNTETRGSDVLKYSRSMRWKKKSIWGEGQREGAIQDQNKTPQHMKLVEARLIWSVFRMRHYLKKEARMLPTRNRLDWGENP